MIQLHSWALAALALAAAAVSAAPAARAQDVMPEPVEQAVSAAEARAEPDQRWAFTRTVTVNDETLSARYDPSRPAGEEWTLLAPASEAALSDAQSGLLDGLRAEPVSDRLLMIEGTHEDYGVRLYVRDGLALARESATEKRYAFEPRDDVGLTFSPPPGSPNLSDHLLGELLITTSEPTLAGVRLYAEDSFKPNAVARINTLDISWGLGAVEPGGPIAIVRSETHIAGRAAFRAFGVDSVTVNSDFARVEAAGDPQPAP